LAQRQPTSARLQPEVRLEFIGARDPIMQLGAGTWFRAGTYARVGLMGAGGAAFRDGRAVLATRVDVQLRYVLDPFAESRWGAYGIGGVSLMHVRGSEVEPRLVLGGGIEGRPRRVVRAVEAGLGGGVRLALALRRGLSGRR
jgi:hypothetical protein